MATFISHHPSDTEALGDSWGRTAQAGLVIALSGELGAGKTRLVKGIAQGLGVAARVHSPSFALLNRYDGGRLTLYHMDLYRLDSLEEIASAGLEEPLTAGGVAVIEWAEKWFHDPVEAARTGLPLPLRYAKIEILGPTERRIDYEDFSS